MRLLLILGNNMIFNSIYFRNIVLVGLFSMVLQNAAANIQIGGTRLIFDGNKNEENLVIKNTDATQPNLVQSWINDEQDSETNSFLVLPPLFRLDNNQEASLRIKLLNKKLPQEKESLFWLSVKSIAPTDKIEKNKLLINFRTKIKLIYRPGNLSKDKKNIFDAFKKLKVKNIASGVKFFNPTPYFINFNRILVNGKDVMNPGYISPFSEKIYSGYNGDNISWQVINDYGGTSSVFVNNQIE